MAGSVGRGCTRRVSELDLPPGRACAVLAALGLEARIGPTPGQCGSTLRVRVISRLIQRR
jgi:hypothetical protein